MYAKVFEQILDSSIAENWKTRHVFEDLLKLATPDGVVDRTHKAIARRLNMPLDIVQNAIIELEKPDPQSRSSEHEGRRLVRLDENRGWGWKIVNHSYYRALKTADDKRNADAERQRRHRANKGLEGKSVTGVTGRDGAVLSVSESVSCPEVFSIPEGGMGGDKEEDGNNGSEPGTDSTTPDLLPNDDTPYSQYPENLRTAAFHKAWQEWKDYCRDDLHKPVTPRSEEKKLRELSAWGEARAIAAIDHTIANQWKGIREPDQNGKGPQSHIRKFAP